MDGTHAGREVATHTTLNTRMQQTGNISIGCPSPQSPRAADSVLVSKISNYSNHDGTDARTRPLSHLPRGEVVCVHAALWPPPVQGTFAPSRLGFIADKLQPPVPNDQLLPASVMGGGGSGLRPRALARVVARRDARAACARSDRCAVPCRTPLLEASDGGGARRRPHRVADPRIERAVARQEGTRHREHHDPWGSRRSRSTS
eukprot:gene46632-biopygen63517